MILTKSLSILLRLALKPLKYQIKYHLPKMYCGYLDVGLQKVVLIIGGKYLLVYIKMKYIF